MSYCVVNPFHPADFTSSQPLTRTTWATLTCAASWVSWSMAMRRFADRPISASEFCEKPWWMVGSFFKRPYIWEYHGPSLISRKVPLSFGWSWESDFCWLMIKDLDSKFHLDLSWAANIECMSVTLEHIYHIFTLTFFCSLSCFCMFCYLSPREVRWFSGFPSHLWWYRTVSINSMNIPLKFHIFHSQSMQYPHSSTIFVGSIPIKPYKTLCFAIFSQDFPMIYSTLSPPHQPPVPGHPFGMPAAQRPARLHHGRHGALRHWDG